MGRLGGISRRGLPLVVIGLTTLVAAASVALAASVWPLGSEPTQLLRLPDLPLGYVNLELREEGGEVPTCERLTEPEDTPPRMLRFVHRFHPRGCVAGFAFSYEHGGEELPAFVVSAVLDAHSRAEANAAWTVAPEILARGVGDKKLRPAKPRVHLGSATRAFHSRVEFVDGPLAVSFLVWRSGTTLATVVGFGGRFGDTDRAVTESARRQQAHIAKPTPYTEDELFDGEVGLENPEIDFPVYWLGRTFNPGSGLLENRFYDSYSRDKPRPESNDRGVIEGPGAPLSIRYENIGLDTWPQGDWPVFARSKTGRAITSWKCTRTRTLAVAGGTATIYGGYNQDFGRCPKRPPRAFTAWVKYRSETVVVNAPFAPDYIEIANDYGSFQGMEAIVRALQPRTRPGS
jgi:hypothetical protein